MVDGRVSNLNFAIRCIVCCDGSSGRSQEAQCQFHQRQHKIKDHAFSKLRPEDKDYWQKRGDKPLGLGHVFKYPYAYYDFLARADDPELEKGTRCKSLADLLNSRGCLS